MIIWSFCRLSPAWSVTRLRWPSLYQTEFIRSARAVGMLWAVCTLCFAVIEVVILIQPSWVGTRELHYRGGPVPPTGTLGLFEVCMETDWPVPECRGSLHTWPHSLPSSPPLCWSACLSSWCGSAWAACVCSDSATQQPSIRSVLGCSSQQVRLFHWSLTKAAFNWSKIQYLNCIILKYFLSF